MDGGHRIGAAALKRRSREDGGLECRDNNRNLMRHWVCEDKDDQKEEDLSILWDIDGNIEVGQLRRGT